MKQRWLPVGVLAGTLFVVNIVARLVVRLAAGKDDGKQFWVGAVALAAVALVMLVAAVYWMRRHQTPRVVGELVLGGFVGGLLSSLIGPLISSGEAFPDGAGGVIADLFYYLVVCGFGAFLGGLGIMIAGLDYKSQSWKRYAEAVNTRRGRPARG